MAGGMYFKLFNSTRFNIDKKNKNSTRLITLYLPFIHWLADTYGHISETSLLQKVGTFFLEASVKSISLKPCTVAKKLEVIFSTIAEQACAH